MPLHFLGSLSLRFLSAAGLLDAVVLFTPRSSVRMLPIEQIQLPIHPRQVLPQRGRLLEELFAGHREELVRVFQAVRADRQVDVLWCLPFDRLDSITAD
jgi:hypothetical protein